MEKAKGVKKRGEMMGKQEGKELHMEEIIIKKSEGKQKLDEAIPINIRRYFDNDVVGTLAKATGSPSDFKTSSNKNSERLNIHCSMVLANLYLAQSPEGKEAILTPLSNDSYAANDPDNPLRITTDYLRDALKLLENNQLLKRTPGFKDRRPGANRGSRVTRFRPTVKLKDLFNTCNVEGKHILTKMPERLMILKDGSKNKVNYEISPYMSSEILMKDYNQMMSSVEIRVGGSRTLPYATVTRIFSNGQWNCGGRLYGSFQNIKSESRASITLNGISTIELDFKGLHPKMLYDLEKQSFEIDNPYNLVFPYKGKKYLVPRWLGKEIFMRGINTNSRATAIAGLNKRLSELDVTFCNGGFLFNALDKIHSGIKHRFHTGYGLRLQFIDSQIALEVLSDCVKHSIPCLPIHDSFLVPIENKEDLKRFMTQAYVKVFKEYGKGIVVPPAIVEKT